MKSIKLVLVTFFVIASQTLLAVNNSDDRTPAEAIAYSIKKLLKNPSFIVEENMDVTVKLTVNKQNEIVILSVDSKKNNLMVENFVKNRLNYKRIDGKPVQAKVYTLPLKIVPTK